MKNKILKTLGVLALATLTVNTMATQNSRIFIHEANIDIVTTAINAINSEFTFDGSKRNRLLLNNMYVNSESLDFSFFKSLDEESRQMLISKLEKFYNTKKADIRPEFSKRIESVINAYKIAGLFGISLGDINQEGNKLNSLINLALGRVQNFDGDQIFRNELIRDLENGGAGAFDTMVMLNLCYNKLNRTPWEIVKCFLGNMPDILYSIDENRLRKNIKDEYLKHISKHTEQLEILVKKVPELNDLFNNNPKHTFIVGKEFSAIDFLTLLITRAENNDEQFSKLFIDLRFGFERTSKGCCIALKHAGGTIDEQSVDVSIENLRDLGDFSIYSSEYKAAEPRENEFDVKLQEIADEINDCDSGLKEMSTRLSNGNDLKNIRTQVGQIKRRMSELEKEKKKIGGEKATLEKEARCEAKKRSIEDSKEIKITYEENGYRVEGEPGLDHIKIFFNLVLPLLSFSGKYGSLFPILPEVNAQ